MSLGTGALKVGKVPEHFRLRQGGIHGNLLSRNHPSKQLPTGTITLKPDQEKHSHDPHTYRKGLKLLKGREG